ncbi:hypothetical protein GCM10009804_28840 [Kribbella hippodromi]|uniref:Uncharacterized protein n=1 Tax=Kribbella hippodromi TaxID=434347 RepID=A0ABN2D7S6_9ACTN
MKYLLLELVGGVAVILAIVIVAGKPLRRRGSPQGPMWRYIALGAVLFLLGGVMYTFPPHSTLFACLVIVLGTGFFCIGIAILGGGYYTYLGAVASGLAAVPFVMTPTPVGLSRVGQTLTCTIRDYKSYGVSEFTADCPNGHSYPFTVQGLREFPGGKLQVIVDPHGLLRAQFVGQAHVRIDLIAGILCLLGATAIVIAAALHRRKLGGQVKPAMNPRPFSSR